MEFYRNISSAIFFVASEARRCKFNAVVFRWHTTVTKWVGDHLEFQTTEQFSTLPDIWRASGDFPSVSTICLKALWCRLFRCKGIWCWTKRRWLLSMKKWIFNNICDAGLVRKEPVIVPRTGTRCHFVQLKKVLDGKRKVLISLLWEAALTFTNRAFDLLVSIMIISLDAVEFLKGTDLWLTRSRSELFWPQKRLALILNLIVINRLLQRILPLNYFLSFRRFLPW